MNWSIAKFMLRAPRRHASPRHEKMRENHLATFFILTSTNAGRPVATERAIPYFLLFPFSLSQSKTHICHKNGMYNTLNTTPHYLTFHGTNLILFLRQTRILVYLTTGRFASPRLTIKNTISTRKRRNRNGNLLQVQIPRSLMRTLQRVYISLTK